MSETYDGGWRPQLYVMFCIYLVRLILFFHGKEKELYKLMGEKKHYFLQFIYIYFYIYFYFTATYNTYITYNTTNT